MAARMPLETRALGLEKENNKAATEGGIVKAASWSDLEMAKGSSVEPPAVVSVKTKLVPADYIESLLQRPLRRPKPRSESFFERFPELRETTLAHSAQINALVDVQEDMLRQHHNKGYAKVGVERFDNGLRRLFILPEEETY